MLTLRIARPQTPRIIVTGAGATFRPAVMPKSADDYFAEAWALVRTLAGRLWPTDTEYRGQVLAWLQHYTEGEMRAQLDRWAAMLALTLKEEHRGGTQSFDTWATNQWNSLRFQRAHVQLWAAGIVARGFAAPDPVALARLDSAAGEQMDVLAQAMQSEAFKRGRAEGERVQQAVSSWSLLHQISAALARIIEGLVELGRKVAALGAQSGAGVILGVLAGLAVLAWLASR